ncbi:ATP-binding protein [Weissella viridescens]|uniref:ATP-binding protein n=1 Tax=Weissella viridescens TaxID=1629 RepID=UPI00405794FA
MENNQQDWLAGLKRRGLLPVILSPEEREAKEKAEAIKYTAMFEKQRRARFKANSSFPDSIDKDFTFRDWDPSKQKDVDKAKQIARTSLNMARELKTTDYNVLFFGNAGAGKTSLAIAMMNELAAVKTTMFVSMIEWLAMKYQSFSDERVANQVYSLEQMMKDVDVLILDDLGKDSQREAKETAAKMLFQVANARTEKTTIITTNDSPKDLGDKYDVATVSRLVPKNAAHIISTNGLQDVREV